MTEAEAFEHGRQGVTMLKCNKCGIADAETTHICPPLTFAATWPAPTATPFRCPVCGGNGLVPNGFYAQTSGTWGSTSTEPEQCRSCTGTGVVWR